jgi:hypothetical protein
MPERSVYLIEAGLAGELPGIGPRVAGASFPFWGTHALFDFAFGALRPLSTDPCWLLCDTRDRQPTQQAALRWGRGAVRQRDSEDGLTELRKLAISERAPWVVVSALSWAGVLEPGELAQGTDMGAGRRLRVDGTPLPVYILRRESLLEAVEEAARQPAESGGSLKGFLMTFLPARIREHLDTPGRVFFADSLMQLWDAHHFLRENLGSGRAARFLKAIDGAQQSSAEAHVGPTGFVKDSLIGAGAQVEGTVVDSVIFPGVAVRRGADVRQCVVMNGARIGADAKAANLLILPCQPEIGGEPETIGAGAEVGETRNVSNSRNDDYPRQIARGLTVLGMGASAPPGIAVESGCFLGPGAAAVLRGMKRLARGASIR